MPLTECAKGHVYNSDLHAFCPYCNQSSTVIDFTNGDNRTVAPNAGPQNSGRTVSPAGSSGQTASPGMNGVNPEDVGKTVAPWAEKRREEEENKTIGFFKQENNYEPVVGWLVCIEGPEKGMDYRIVARINTIGRSEKMDICIRKDKEISREYHARIAYDQKHNVFQLASDKNTNVMYVNDQLVMGSVVIRAFDVIETGKSKFLFIPLCGERFEWKSGLKPSET